MIDWNRVSELREEIGADDFNEVVEIFLEEAEEEMAALRDGVPKESLADKLHFLKGCALNLGFIEFLTLCQKGEQAAAVGQYEDIDLMEILQSFDRSKVEFVDSLKSKFAA